MSGLRFVFQSMQYTPFLSVPEFAALANISLVFFFVSSSVSAFLYSVCACVLLVQFDLIRIVWSGCVCANQSTFLLSFSVDVVVVGSVFQHENNLSYLWNEDLFIPFTSKVALPFVHRVFCVSLSLSHSIFCHFVWFGFSHCHFATYFFSCLHLALSDFVAVSFFFLRKQFISSPDLILRLPFYLPTNKILQIFLFIQCDEMTQINQWILHKFCVQNNFDFSISIYFVLADTQMMNEDDLVSVSF